MAFQLIRKREKLIHDGFQLIISSRGITFHEAAIGQRAVEKVDVMYDPDTKAIAIVLDSKNPEWTLRPASKSTYAIACTKLADTVRGNAEAVVYQLTGQEKPGDGTTVIVFEPLVQGESVDPDAV